MNHLEIAKLFLEEEHDNTQKEYELAGITHALIAIAEVQQDRVCAIEGLHQTMEKIAEQLERMNNQELRTEKLDFHTVTRKVDR